MGEFMQTAAMVRSSIISHVAQGAWHKAMNLPDLEP
jgi:hypothetical protein